MRRTGREYKIDMDFSYQGREFWVCGEVTLDDDLWCEGIFISEVAEYSDSGKTDSQVDPNDLDGNCREAMEEAMIQNAVEQAEEGY